jgi:hypothetical protein
VEDLSTGKIHRDASTSPRHVALATLGLSYTTSVGAWRVRCCLLARKSHADRTAVGPLIGGAADMDGRAARPETGANDPEPNLGRIEIPQHSQHSPDATVKVQH